MERGAPASPQLLLYHHVVLPRDVPGQEHNSLHKTEDELAARLVHAVKSLASQAPSEDYAALDALRLTLSTCRSIHVDGKIDKGLLQQELCTLDHHRVLVMHVTEQNAALLVYRHVTADGAEEVIFEAFETSPACEKVLEAENALLWDFPGQAVAVPYSVFSRDDFQSSISTFLEHASFESIKQFAAITHKACAPQAEVRDTPSPTLVTNMLMGILKAVGSRHSVTILRKRVHDSVSFNKAYKPWRRSPFYLVLRVAIQRYLYKVIGREKGHFYYKVVMCIFMSTLLEDVVDHIPDESTFGLQQKLGRRLAKIEVDRERGSDDRSRLHAIIFQRLGVQFNKTLTSTSRYLQSQWEAHKRRTTRVIRAVPQKASETDTQLSLPNSGQRLHYAMEFQPALPRTKIGSAKEILDQFNRNAAQKPSVMVMKQYYELCNHEAGITRSFQRLGVSGDPKRCMQLAKQIEGYISAVQDAYTDYTEFKSRQLLWLMELWKTMDEDAILCYPILADYHPVFKASMLDVLELSTFDEFERLQAVQTYISGRCRVQQGRGLGTIFDDPSEKSFAVRYYDAADDSNTLHDLREEIEAEAEELLQNKEAEWEHKSTSHENLIEEMAELSCVYTTEMNERGFHERVHVKPCRKHKLKWQAKQIKIDVFEFPLPDDEHARKAVIFELRCPEAFAAYRDATWSILSKFGFPKRRTVENVPLLRHYPGLAGYSNTTRSWITLGSSTKSHLSSHYKEHLFPVPFDNVHRPFGMKLRYFDSDGQTWTSITKPPIFGHLFPIKLPTDSPFLPFESLGAGSWPTSNSTLATQMRCPVDLNIHEYTAWQGILLGTFSRWPCLLREMGSTNINFSSESTWAIVSRLIHQVGPATYDVLRDVHSLLDEPTFCATLLDQVEYRLGAIVGNWRESTQMDLLLTMLVQVTEFSTNTKARSKAIELIDYVRIITKGWCSSLQADSHDVGVEPSTFTIWAAILCKRSCYQGIRRRSRVTHDILQDWIIASIILQDNLTGKLDAFPYSLRNAIVRDITLAYNCRSVLYEAIQTNSTVLIESVKHFWPIPDTTASVSVEVVPVPDTSWICLIIFGKGFIQQRHAHYNIIDGTLLINGEQLGMLSLEYRRFPIITELFGTQAIPSYPSPLLGMSVFIRRKMPYGHEVHLGFRDGELVIRAVQDGIVHELFCREIFQGPRHYDLPYPLIDNCYHWLDLKQGILEVRQQNPWKSKKSNWRLDVTTRRATRNEGSMLVDPNSALALRVMQNFVYFEFPQQITVFQPPASNLRVELKRLELDFKVVKYGRLFCVQLGAVIADTQSQDIGTWYGLKSKLVLRTTQGHVQRSVLVPSGPQTCKRDGPHVSILIKPKGEYLKFTVNEVLGRIDCPAEPNVMYLRAFWHASTAYILPDPLTKRTGTDEAMQYLNSGAYQPWNVLSVAAAEILQKIAKLSPRRAYYPPKMKVMEVVRWDPDRTMYMQDDRYRRTIEGILVKSEQLSQFVPVQTSSSDKEFQTGHADRAHLESRSICRNMSNPTGVDMSYRSRDEPSSGLSHKNVIDMTNLLDDWLIPVKNTTHLPRLLEHNPTIGGYVRSYNTLQITDILETDVGIEWGALVLRFRNLQEERKFEAIFLMALLAFSDKAKMDLLRVIASFALIPDLRSLALPTPSVYSRFQLHHVIEVETIIKLVAVAKKPYVSDINISDWQSHELRLDHDEEATKACRQLGESIRAQWPHTVLNTGNLVAVQEKLLNRNKALQSVLPEWIRCTHNMVFSQHLDKVQLILDENKSDTRPGSQRPATPEIRHIEPLMYPLRRQGGELLDLKSLLAKNLAKSVFQSLESESFSASVSKQGMGGLEMPTSSPITPLKQLVSFIPYTKTIPSQIRELRQLVQPYMQSVSMVHKRYGEELDQSIVALSDRLRAPGPTFRPFNPSEISSDAYNTGQIVKNKLDKIAHVLSQDDSRAQWLIAAGLWPPVTITSLLSELRSTSGTALGDYVKEALVDLGLCVTHHQRALRIQGLADKNRIQQRIEEQGNIGHTNWSPLQYPDWLLLEVESNIMIRPEQVDVALATISPDPGQNSVVQLLMGKGKTSCILPMVALVLAEKNMFRIVLPRPLLLQSAQIMQAKLGGLLNRQIMHIPFSRKTPTSIALISSYCELHNQIKRQSGIMLALPEHLLSFKLSGLQRLCDGEIDEARAMIKMQDWLDQHSRDVLDECDVSLAIRTQLIYPSGSQQTVDGHPLRWQTIQELLDLIASSLNHLCWKFENSIEVVRRPGYPLIYFLRKDVEDYLITELVNQISKGQTAILPVAGISAESQMDIRKYMTEATMDKETTSRVAKLFVEQRHLMDVMHHLRGLFVHRILLSTLKKRWNVQYGLHPDRDPIAVPYSAKGVPSATAEWGHPDVAIILTCLSFYYEGLSTIQFRRALEKLAKSDEPSIEYSLWVADGIPDSLKNYNAINVEDQQQLRELHHYLRYKVSLLNFYLNSFVFPQHAKQFSLKLSASGSDLIMFDINYPERVGTTGFSGTNDTRHQLPMTIKQNDLPQLAHTNAEVLSYLLETRNRKYIEMVDSKKKRLTEEGLLQKIRESGTQESPTRILIDAGAQILEHDNRSLAKLWLKVDHGAAAAVYFNDDHRAMVLYGKGSNIPLLESPFAEDLDKCLVYIDESHCRGTDLKLPPKAVAAVTLGPHLTKDALVQAAMRLRLLGKTQSVIFFSPPEVHQSIVDLRTKSKGPSDATPTSADVIRWLLDQTCNAIEQLEPLYFNQGLNYIRRTQGRLSYPNFFTDVVARTKYVNVIRSRELQTLKQLYEPKHDQRSAIIKPSEFDATLRKYVIELLERRKGFQDQGSAAQASALEEVEQEREVEFEVESVREVQPPVYFKAMPTPALHADISVFALTGQIPTDSGVFHPMISVLGKTALSKRHDTIMDTNAASRLFVSTQFTSTVVVKEANDNFLRPCHWLLWSTCNQVGVLVSHEEADELIPVLRGSDDVPPNCHLIVYAAPITRGMLQFNNLDYYAIPPLPADFKAPTWLKVELGFFSGRLYFDWDEYNELMAYLGIRSSEADSSGNDETACRQAFATNSLVFLHDWLALRRKGQDFEHTPMGFVTTGKPLSANHPFFSTTQTGSAVDAPMSTARGLYVENDSDDESDDGDDNAKEHLFQHGDEVNDVDHFQYADDGFDDDNTFFDQSHDQEIDGKSKD